MTSSGPLRRRVGTRDASCRSPHARSVSAGKNVWQDHTPCGAEGLGQALEPSGVSRLRCSPTENPCRRRRARAARSQWRRRSAAGRASPARLSSSCPLGFCAPSRQRPATKASGPPVGAGCDDDRGGRAHVAPGRLGGGRAGRRAPARGGRRASRLRRPGRRRAGWRSTTRAPTRSARSPRASWTPAVVVCPCHGSEFDVRTGDVLSPPALEPLAIYEAREEAGTVLVRLAPPAAAADAVHEREDHVPESVARQATVAAPSTDGPGARRRRSDRSGRLGAGRPPRLAGAAAARGAALLAPGDRRSRLLGVHALRRHRRGVEGLADLQLRARRDVSPGSDPRGGRGAEVDARHGPTRAHPPARDRQQGLHTARHQHLRGAHPRSCPRHPREGVRARRSSTSSRTSPQRSRCGSSRRSWACPSTTESS